MFVKMVYQLVQGIVYAKLVDKIQINYNVCQFAQNFLFFFFESCTDETTVIWNYLFFM